MFPSSGDIMEYASDMLDDMPTDKEPIDYDKMPPVPLWQFLLCCGILIGGAWLFLKGVIAFYTF